MQDNRYKLTCIMHACYATTTTTWCDAYAYQQVFGLRSCVQKSCQTNAYTSISCQILNLLKHIFFILNLIQSHTIHINTSYILYQQPTRIIVGISLCYFNTIYNHPVSVHIAVDSVTVTHHVRKIAVTLHFNCVYLSYFHFRFRES